MTMRSLKDACLTACTLVAREKVGRDITERTPRIGKRSASLVEKCRRRLWPTRQRKASAGIAREPARPWPGGARMRAQRTGHALGVLPSPGSGRRGNPMGDTMLLGVLRMPLEMAMASPLDQMQFHGRARQ